MTLGEKEISKKEESNDLKINPSDIAETQTGQTDGEKTCTSCNMKVRNLETHLNHNKCRHLPYPHTKKTAKKSPEKLDVLGDLRGLPNQDPAPFQEGHSNEGYVSVDVTRRERGQDTSQSSLTYGDVESGDQHFTPQKDKQM